MLRSTLLLFTASALLTLAACKSSNYSKIVADSPDWSMHGGSYDEQRLKQSADSTDTSFETSEKEQLLPGRSRMRSGWRPYQFARVRLAEPEPEHPME